MKAIPFMVVGALFLLKLVANTMAPIALLRRPRGPKGHAPGVSLMPYVEVMLLGLLVGLAIVGWAPIRAWATMLGGVAAIVVSYLLLFVVVAVLAGLRHLDEPRR